MCAGTETKNGDPHRFHLPSLALDILKRRHQAAGKPAAGYVFPARYAKDLEIELDAQIADLEDEVKELRKQSRAAGLSMEEKLALKRKIKRLEDDVDEIKLAKFTKRKEARQKVEDMLDDFAAQLNQKPTIKPLVTVRWAVE